MSGIQLPDGCKLAINWKKDNDVTIYWHDIVKFVFYLAVLLLSSLVTGPSFMSVSWLVMELWKFLFIKDLPEIWKLEISPSGFCPESVDCGKLGIPNMAQMSLIKSYWMLQNAIVTAFNVSELLTLIWVGLLWVVCVWGGGWGGWREGGWWGHEIWYVHTQPYVVSGNIPFTTKAVLILLMSASFFFLQISFFFSKIIPLLKTIVWELC